MDPVLARQGFSESDLILHWDDIVGEHLAARSRPLKLQWPPRPPGRGPDQPPQPATLVIRVEGAYALQLQHSADQIVQRVNAHLGWRCVGRLALRQGPLPRAGARHVRPPPLPAPLVEAVARQLGDVADPDLRDALVRLGARVAQRAHRP